MNTKRLLLIASAIVLCSITSIATVAVCRGFNEKSLSNLSTQTLIPKSGISGEKESNCMDFTTASEKSVHSVVHVKVKYKLQNQYRGRRGGFNDPFFDFFFGQPQEQYQMPERQDQMAAGSGVIISHDGYIVTNNHVIDKASEIEVTLNDKRTFNAKVIGTDPATDIALIKIDAPNLQPIVFGNSDNLKVGQWVLAVGNPFNLTSTVTAGIVSAKARNINILNAERKIESFIQTDAAINPGNSGGALVNTNGELVGINTAIASQTGSYTGYAFAIPTTIVSKVVSDLKEYGTVQRAILGVQITNIDDKLAKEKEIKTLNGAYVASAMSGSSAEEAGIRQGDVITAINGVGVNSVAELQEQIAAYRPGDKIDVTIIRKDKEHKFNLKLKNSSGNTNIIKGVDISNLGVVFMPLDMQTKMKLRYNGGLLVKEVKKGGLFAKAGIEAGLILLKINDKQISSVDDVEQAYYNAINNDDIDKALLVTGINNKGNIARYIINLK